MSRARLPAVEPAAVRVAAPDRVDLGEVGVATPVARVDQRQQSGAVRARLGTEDAARGPALVAVAGRSGRSACTCARSGLISAGSSSAATARIASSSKRDHVREGVAEEAADAHGDVDARPAELLDGHHLEAGDPARGVVPDRPNPQQCQHFGDVVALGAHGAGAPDGQPDRRGIARRCRRGSGRRARSRAPCRSPRPAATGSPWDRRSRSCARSAAR